MAIDPFDPWYLYDFWALRGKYGEEEKRKAQMREKIRREERDKFYMLMDVGMVVIGISFSIGLLMILWKIVTR